MPDLFLVIISLISLTLTLLSFLLFLREYKVNRNIIQKEQSKTLENAEKKGFELISSAIKKAQVILSKAELAEVEQHANSTIQSQKLEQAFEQKFKEGATEAQQIFATDLKTFTQNVEKSHEEYLLYLESLKADLQKIQFESSQQVKGSINSIFEKFEQNLTDFLTESEEKTVKSIELELRAARELIDSYKSQQLKLVDENIVAVLERTLNLVLAKKLTLKDQTDLIYESLEKAKQEKFIAL